MNSNINVIPKRHFMFTLCKLLQSLEDEDKMTGEQLAIKNVGRQDPKRHLEENIDKLMNENIVQTIGSMLHTISFK